MIVVKILGTIMILGIIFLIVRAASRTSNKQHDIEVIRIKKLKEKYNDDKLRCPKCGSDSIITNKKGFSVGKAAVGAFVAGPIGLAAGGIGGDDIMCTCGTCNHKFKLSERL